MEEGSNSKVRFTVLVLLCAQNAGHALLARYSQGILKESYSSTEVVLVAEMVKLIASAYLTLSEGGSTETTNSTGAANGFLRLWYLVINAKNILWLVFLYGFANLLSYYALARVEASVYTVLLQLKILTTAAFAVMMLGRNITATKWRSLMLLVIGCLLVASPAFNRPTECDEVAVAVASTRSARAQKTAVVDSRTDLTSSSEDVVNAWDSVMGVGAVLLMVTISGFASIYFEGILKKSGDRVLTIWERNFQLAFYSAIVLLVYLVLEENAQGTLASYVLFEGWTVNTVLIALIQAGGGLLVAATLKYADAVLKTLATSGSIVLSAVLGCLLLGGTLDIFVSIGCLATILAIFNYTLDSTPPPPPPAIAAAVPSRQDV